MEGLLLCRVESLEFICYNNEILSNSSNVSLIYKLFFFVPLQRKTYVKKIELK